MQYWYWANNNFSYVVKPWGHIIWIILFTDIQRAELLEAVLLLAM